MTTRSDLHKIAKQRYFMETFGRTDGFIETANLTAQMLVIEAHNDN